MSLKSVFLGALLSFFLSACSGLKIVEKESGADQVQGYVRNMELQKVQGYKRSDKLLVVELETKSELFVTFDPTSNLQKQFASYLEIGDYVGYHQDYGARKVSMVFKKRNPQNCEIWITYLYNRSYDSKLLSFHEKGCQGFVQRRRYENVVELER